MPASRHAEWFGVAVVAALGAVLVGRHAETERGAPPFAAATVGEYCADCHDPVMRSGGVVLPRPSAAAYERMASYLW